MKLVLTDRDLKDEAKNKSIEDIYIYDFNEGIYLDSKVVPIIHLVEYLGKKGRKVFKDFDEESESSNKISDKDAKIIKQLRELLDKMKENSGYSLKESNENPRILSESRTIYISLSREEYDRALEEIPLRYLRFLFQVE